MAVQKYVTKFDAIAAVTLFIVMGVLFMLWADFAFDTPVGDRRVGLIILTVTSLAINVGGLFFCRLGGSYFTVGATLGCCYALAGAIGIWDVSGNGISIVSQILCAYQLILVLLGTCWMLETLKRRSEQS